jgi:hypothetical protein
MAASGTLEQLQQYYRLLLAEQRRRTPGGAINREAAIEQLLDQLEQMAERLRGSAYPGDGALMEKLLALALEKDDAGLEAARMEYDLAPAEVVAWLIAAGDGATAFDVLGRYATRIPAAS